MHIIYEKKGRKKNKEKGDKMKHPVLYVLAHFGRKWCFLVLRLPRNLVINNKQIYPSTQLYY